MERTWRLRWMFVGQTKFKIILHLLDFIRKSSIALAIGHQNMGKSKFSSTIEKGSRELRRASRYLRPAWAFGSVQLCPYR
jgi:hypothetical protein